MFMFQVKATDMSNVHDPFITHTMMQLNQNHLPPSLARRYVQLNGKLTLWNGKQLIVTNGKLWN